MLKIQFKPVPPSSEDSHNFTFASPTSALNDRERFKQELSDAIARNREHEAALASQQAQAASAAGDPKGKGKERAVDSPTPGPGARTPGTPGGAGGAPGPRGAPSQATTFQLRKQVLQSNPQLLALHRELVLSSQITEAEFWEGREDLVAAVAAEQGLVKGKSGEMVDPKTVTGQNGEVTVKITPALIREIFEEFPVVLRAYNDNVPDPVRSPRLFLPRCLLTSLRGPYSSTKPPSGLATSSPSCSTATVRRIAPQWMQSRTTPSSTSTSAWKMTVRGSTRSVGRTEHMAPLTGALDPLQASSRSTCTTTRFTASSTSPRPKRTNTRCVCVRLCSLTGRGCPC